jgi:hypothetical protein
MSLSDYSCKQFLGDQPHALGTAALQLERMAMFWRTMRTWTTTFAVLTALATAMGCVNAQAQLWPQRPVRVVAPYAAGGNSDGMARIVAQRLTDAFGQTFVVENRLGANGAIATEAVARSPADGYTLLWGATPPLTINPALTKVNYDPIKDFAPISVVAVNAFVLVVNKSFPPKTVAEFIAHVRAQPNKLAYAEGSAGSLTHLTMALFLKRAGLQMTNVSYRGNAPPTWWPGICPPCSRTFPTPCRRLPPARSDFSPFQAKSARRSCPMCRLSPNPAFPGSTCSPGMG